jgi:NADPH:quinone reductase-like Zn-dependent oxidoreductase
MKAYEIARPGSIDAPALAERPRPKPGHGQVLMRVRACSLNYRDLAVVRGTYARGLKLPLIPLSDGAGEIVEAGPGVTRFAVGERVAAIFMQSWSAGRPREEYARSALGGAIDGMLAEYVALDQEGLVAIPAHLTYEEAATLPCAAVTAWNALISEGRLKPGDTVLVLGSGGVSVFALQFARLTGARVIATSSSEKKLARLLELGASDAVNYRTTAEWDKRVRELTAGRGVDHVVEVGGAGTLARSLNAVRQGGRVSLIGMLTGAGEVDPLPVLRKAITLQGIYVGSREMFEEMNRAIEAAAMRPVIDRVFEFAAAREAYRYLESAAHFGKIVVTL